MSRVRVLRVIEYTGPHLAVEKQVFNSVHGTKEMTNGVTIRAATIGTYPELLPDELPVEVLAGAIQGATDYEFDKTQAIRMVELVRAADKFVRGHNAS